jgi:glucoamylase
MRLQARPYAKAPRPFLLHWTDDDWQAIHDVTATPTALGIHFVDIPIGRSQQAPVRFTFLWTDSGEWEGRDYAVFPLTAGSETELPHV